MGKNNRNRRRGTRADRAAGHTGKVNKTPEKVSVQEPVQEPVQETPVENVKTPSPPPKVEAPPKPKSWAQRAQIVETEEDEVVVDTRYKRVLTEDEKIIMKIASDIRNSKEMLEKQRFDEWYSASSDYVENIVDIAQQSVQKMYRTNLTPDEQNDLVNAIYRTTAEHKRTKKKLVPGRDDFYTSEEGFPYWETPHEKIVSFSKYNQLPFFSQGHPNYGSAESKMLGTWGHEQFVDYSCLSAKDSTE
jgi:hypothetical protein